MWVSEYLVTSLLSHSRDGGGRLVGGTGWSEGAYIWLLEFQDQRFSFNFFNTMNLNMNSIDDQQEKLRK